MNVREGWINLFSVNEKATFLLGKFQWMPIISNLYKCWFKMSLKFFKLKILRPNNECGVFRSTQIRRLWLFHICKLNTWACLHFKSSFILIQILSTMLTCCPKMVIYKRIYFSIENFDFLSIFYALIEQTVICILATNNPIIWVWV